MSTEQARLLSDDEISEVSGAWHICATPLPGGKTDLTWCQNWGVEELIDAFLDGVEKGKNKGQQKQ